ncbi:MAG: DNA polymerase [Acidimicrobiales bacterium]
MGDPDPVGAVARAGAVRGGLVALALHPAVGLAMATSTGSWSSAAGDPCRVVAAVEDALRPRWVTWSNDTAVTLARAGVRVATAWDLAAVHRLLAGGMAADPARVWALAHGLAVDALPGAASPDLFSSLGEDGTDPDDPLRPDGYLRPEWVSGGWCAGLERLRQWSVLAVTVAALQQAALAGLVSRPAAIVTARSESATELLCAEMTVDGLPMDRFVAEGIVAGFVGPRPSDETEAVAARARRDAEVLRYASPGSAVDLRSTVQVKALLSGLGVHVPDTRAGRLRALQHRHPAVGAFLAWRKAERVATTFGYAWLDEHLGADGRLRGAWTGSDGAAGRMTASGGLHNMPADFRPAVVAEAGHVFVRADLGQIEPRVLAAVSGDVSLAGATLDGDLYAPVAAQLGIDRQAAKVAVLGAMYGQTSGNGALALRGLAAAYPVAMGYLDSAARAAEEGRDLRTHGGRLVRMAAPAGTEAARGLESRGEVAARGRYGRNAVVQGAAAELFKIWAVTVRARCASLGAQIVLCLHDELLVHVPTESGDAVARLVSECLDDAVARWAPGTPVRFVAEVGVIARWSDAKDEDARHART